MTALSCRYEDEGIKKRGVREKGLEGKIVPNPCCSNRNSHHCGKIQ